MCVLLYILLVIILSNYSSGPISVPTRDAPTTTTPFVPRVSCAPVSDSFLANTCVNGRMSTLAIPPRGMFVGDRGVINCSCMDLYRIRKGLSICISGKRVASCIFNDAPFGSGRRFQRDFSTIGRGITRLLDISGTRAIFINRLSSNSRISAIFTKGNVLGTGCRRSKCDMSIDYYNMDRTTAMVIRYSNRE